MSQTNNTAPLGASAKSPGAARSLHPIDLNEVAKYVQALRYRVHHDHPVCHEYIDRLAAEIRQMPVPIQSPMVVDDLHALEAYGRLLRSASDTDYEMICRSVRTRITHSLASEIATVGLWRALWAGLHDVGYGASTASISVGMALLADVITASVRSIRLLQIHAKVTRGGYRGGLAAQRNAWADADR